jgi:YteA family regulatory protein
MNPQMTEEGANVMPTTDDLSRFRSILIEEQHDLQKRLKANEHFDTELGLIKESLGELSNYDNHPADHGTEMFEREKDIALNEHAEEQLSDIEHALEAINNGSYGSCEVCGQEIPLERLEALPTTTRCIQHSPNKFVSLKRPVEEDVLGPPFGKFVYDEEDTTFYDAEDAWQDVERYGTSDTPFAYDDQEKLDYNEMFIESEEPEGYVEAVEGFLLADIEGNFIGVAPNKQHEKYEEMLDDANEDDIL